MVDENSTKKLNCHPYAILASVQIAASKQMSTKRRRIRLKPDDGKLENTTNELLSSIKKESCIAAVEEALPLPKISRSRRAQLVTRDSAKEKKNIRSTNKVYSQPEVNSYGDNNNQNDVFTKRITPDLNWLEENKVVTRSKKTTRRRNCCMSNKQICNKSKTNMSDDDMFDFENSRTASKNVSTRQRLESLVFDEKTVFTCEPEKTASKPIRRRRSCLKSEEEKSEVSSCAEVNSVLLDCDSIASTDEFSTGYDPSMFSTDPKIKTRSLQLKKKSNRPIKKRQRVAELSKSSKLNYTDSITNTNDNVFIARKSRNSRHKLDQKVVLPPLNELNETYKLM